MNEIFRIFWKSILRFFDWVEGGGAVKLQWKFHGLTGIFFRISDSNLHLLIIWSQSNRCIVKCSGRPHWCPPKQFFLFNVPFCRSHHINVQLLLNYFCISGCFNLDPNRVLDVILDSFESHYEQSDFYIPLLKAYMPQSKTLSDVLGFKYVHYIEAKLVTPKSLYIITAFLLQHQAIYLDDMYGWVSYNSYLFFLF